MLKIPSRILNSVREILSRYAPGAEVWAYGSRVTGRAHAGSDLDLVLRDKRRPRRPTTNLSAIRDAFSESDIPILVDLQDWARIPKSFREEIARNHVIVRL